MRIFLNRVVFNDVLLKITLLISTIFYCIPPLMPIVDTFINLLLVWTLIFLLHEFLTRDTYFNSNYYIFAFLAALFYGITFLVRGTHIIDLKIL